jgi:hypothetical protein
MLALALLLTCWAYRSVWSASFVYEDENAVFANPSVTGKEPIQWHRARVLSAISHRLVWKAWPNSPRAAHLANLGLHLVNGVLVYAIAGVFLSPWASVLVASLFLLHPIQTEAVAYVASRSELLACLFALLAFWRSLTATRWWEQGLVWLAVALAVCAKESSAVIVPLMVVSDLYRGKRLSWLQLAACVVPISLMAYSVWRYEYMFRADRGVLEYAATQATAIWRYLGLVLVPRGLTIDFDFDLVPLLVRYVALALLVSVGCGALLLTCTIGDEDRTVTRLWEWFPGARVVGFGVAWLLVALLPRMVVPLNEVLNLHQTLLPFLGVWLAVGSLFEARDSRWVSS